MLRIRPATMLDIDGFRLNGRQAALMPGWLNRLANHIRAEEAWLATWYEQPVAFAGMTVMWEDRAAAWCFLADDIPCAAWLPMTRMARRVIWQTKILRIEADVASDFPPAVRWARALGLKFEGAMDGYWQGKQFLRFARIAT